MLFTHRESSKPEPESPPRQGLLDFLTPTQAREYGLNATISFTGSDGGLYRILTWCGSTHNVQVMSPRGVLRKAHSTDWLPTCTCPDCNYQRNHSSTTRRRDLLIPYGTALCALPRCASKEDVWLQQILLIRADEQAFLRVANIGYMEQAPEPTDGWPVPSRPTYVYNPTPTTDPF